jgi:hypothetical protein
MSFFSRASDLHVPPMLVADHTNDPDPRKMLEQRRKVKPASSSDPVSEKPIR